MNVIVTLISYGMITSYMAVLIGYIVITITDLVGRRNIIVGKRTKLIIIANVNGSLEDVNVFLAHLSETRLGSVEVVFVRTKQSGLSQRSLNDALKRTHLLATVYSPRKQYDDLELLQRAYAKSGKRSQSILYCDTTMRYSTAVLKRMTMLAFESTTSAIVILPITDSDSGVSGVIKSLDFAIRRLLLRLILLKKFSMHMNGGYSYLLPAKHLAVHADNRTVKTRWDSRLAGQKITNKNEIGFGLTRARILLLLAGIIALTLLSTAALNQYGLQPFTIAWVTLCIAGLTVAIGDMYLTYMQRLAILACTGFMPLLWILASLCKQSKFTSSRPLNKFAK